MIINVKKFRRLVYVSSMVDLGFVLWSGQTRPMTIKLVFVASPQSKQYKEVRAKTGWYRLRIMYLTRATYLSMDSCFSELAI